MKKILFVLMILGSYWTYSGEIINRGTHVEDQKIIFELDEQQEILKIRYVFSEKEYYQKIELDRVVDLNNIKNSKYVKVEDELGVPILSRPYAILRDPQVSENINLGEKILVGYFETLLLPLSAPSGFLRNIKAKRDLKLLKTVINDSVSKKVNWQRFLRIVSYLGFDLDNSGLVIPEVVIDAKNGDIGNCSLEMWKTDIYNPDTYRLGSHFLYYKNQLTSKHIYFDLHGLENKINALLDSGKCFYLEN